MSSISVQSAALPASSLLAQSMAGAGYGDCFEIEVGAPVTLARLIEAFFTSLAFRPEWLVLRCIGHGGSDAGARALALGQADGFAAWGLLARTDGEILLQDFAGRTRCWLSAAPCEGGTRLRFGSGIIPRTGSASAAQSENALFRALVPFHRFYSRVLLVSAARRAVKLAGDDRA